MVATLVHLFLWLAAALAVVWTLSSLGVVVLAVAALRAHHRVVGEAPEAVGASTAEADGASVTRLVPVAAGAQSRLLV
jgi:hypothetical protein